MREYQGTIPLFFGIICSTLKKQCIASVRLAIPKIWSVQAATSASMRPIFSPQALNNIDYCVEANNCCSMDASTDCGAKSFMERGILVRDAV
jgi:hypothetical protein